TEHLLVGGRRQRRCSDMSIDDRRWTLLDPISSTAKRIRSVYPVRGLGRRFLRGLFFPLTVERIGRCFAGRRGDGLGAQGRPPSFQSDLEKVNSGERLAKNAS